MAASAETGMEIWRLNRLVDELAAQEAFVLTLICHRVVTHWRKRHDQGGSTLDHVPVPENMNADTSCLHKFKTNLLGNL